MRSFGPSEDAVLIWAKLPSERAKRRAETTIVLLRAKRIMGGTPPVMRTSLEGITDAAVKREVLRFAQDDKEGSPALRFLQRGRDVAAKKGGMRRCR
jgi:hypothetical protein